MTPRGREPVCYDSSPDQIVRAVESGKPALREGHEALLHADCLPDLGPRIIAGRLLGIISAYSLTAHICQAAGLELSRAAYQVTQKLLKTLNATETPKADIPECGKHFHCR